ncbi:AAA family ATPase [Candidatus Micrarchaeota archaeon]|nr:AAA family ATPase [Candidatus Micrarchaeota archaeon]
MIIIGFTGRNAAGKTTATKYLTEKGFYYKSLSDVIREEAKKRGMESTRENLIAIGNELREKHGVAALSELTLQRMESGKNYVVDSIRHPAEALALKAAGNFSLFHIFAPVEKRFKRTLERQRVGDPQTLQEFIRLEEKEFQSSNVAAQQLLECERMSNRMIENNGELERFQKELDAALKELEVSFSRPSWDEYFMGIAKQVAVRSNCMKRQVAAIIAKDKRIISTGYNGTPRSVKNCNEGGCPRCNNFAESGKALEECLCSHGEENAIVQAAYHGISVKGATIYSTFSPCLLCSKMIINSGLTRVVYNEAYPLNDTALKMLREAGIEIAKSKI